MIQRSCQELINSERINSADFSNLIEDLISTFVYRSVTMQKVIHLLIAQHQEELTSCILENQNNINNNRNAETSQISSVTTTTEGIPNNIGESSNTRTLVRCHKCYAIKCRLL